MRWRALGLALGMLGGACSIVTDFASLSSDGPPLNEGGADTSSADVVVPVEGGDGDVDAGSYHPKFARALTVENRGTFAAPEGTPVCLVVSEAVAGAVGSKSEADLRDIRVVGAGGRHHPRVIDIHESGITTVCFRLGRAVAAGANDSGYAVHYGDPNASAFPNGYTDVFDFYDGFGGATVDATVWTVRGAVTVGNGNLVLGTGDTAIASKPSVDRVPTEASLEVRARVLDPTSDGTNSFFYWLGFHRYGDFEVEQPWSVFIARFAGAVVAEHKTVTGSCQSLCASSATPQTNTFRTYRIDRRPSGVAFTSDNGTAFEATGDNGDMAVVLRNFLAKSVIEIDWVRARPLLPIDPALTLGAETVLP